LIAAIPSGRSGITLHNDWDNMGQRQTDSGSASFERVRVEESEVNAGRERSCRSRQSIQNDHSHAPAWECSP